MTTQSENLALHRPATFSAAPNYALLSGADAQIQLTDGCYATDAPQISVNDTGALWVQKGTLGWTNVSPVIITIDLGQEQSIGGALFSTAAGAAGVNWPLHVFIGVSDDNENWRFAGDLVALSDKIQVPPAHGYAAWRYRTHDLKARGRYVAFAVMQVPYAFADQIEIYRGPNDLPQSPMRAEAVVGTDEFARTSVMRGAVSNLLTRHAEAIARELQSANLPTELRLELQDQLDGATAAIETLPVPDADTFRAVLPFNDTHAKILAVHGAILGAQKAGPRLWQQPRYQWLPLLATPPDKASPHLQIAMMKNEFRADALMLTNASASALDASLQLDGPLAQHRAALQISAMPWTDTAQGVAVAAALPVLVADENGSCKFSVAAGLTTKLWFSLDSSQLPVGVHQGDIYCAMNGQTAQVPYTIRVSPVTMNQPRLSLGVWDYTDGDSAFDINEANRASAIERLRSHGADTAWAQKRALPLPGADDFDANHELIAPLNWKPFEAWRERWPDARQYFVYLDVPTEFAGARLGTPQFDARVSSWARRVTGRSRTRLAGRAVGPVVSGRAAQRRKR